MKVRRVAVHPSIELLYGKRGNLAKVVKASGLSAQAVSKWKRYRTGVPVAHVRVVARVLGVPLYRLRPDVYLPPQGTRRKRDEGSG